ncbi:alpha/beta hydrolase [Sporosarcina sp. FA9]|uniref:alpha/beta hydrolase n=1 Tax=Sporosarcina sp. FA9 TaxID=3413030 RepID=UPI003F65EA22
MRVSQPKPFFIEEGKRAVLLLHGFTGTSADVRMLGRFLEKKGYTSHAPHYKGHGVPPEELIHTGPEEWWEDVLQGYNKLKDAGYDEIAVAGLSLGGVFSLKLGYNIPLKGIITMCAPMTMKTTDVMYSGVLKYAKEYKKFERKSEEVIADEMKKLQLQEMPSLTDLRELVYDVRKNVDTIYAPLFVVQGSLDDVIEPESATVIYEYAESVVKQIKWYDKSGHVITLGPEKEMLYEDIYKFLESLDWSV